MDGECSIVIKTEKGEETLILNQGMAPGGLQSCSGDEATANQDAFYLLPGDKVEIQVPVSSGNYLCGKGASVTRLDIPHVPLRIIRGVVIKQIRACIEQQPAPCGVVVKTSTGMEEILWGQENKIGYFGPDCRSVRTAREVGGLKLNDEVEIDLPVSSGNHFCGDGALLKNAPDPIDARATRDILGVVLSKHYGCREMSTGDGTCTLTVQADTGTETFITAYRESWHPQNCHFNQPLQNMPEIAPDDEVEIHVPLGSGNVICGNGAALIKRTDHPLRAKALAIKATDEHADPAIRVVRGILVRTDSFGLLVETGNKVESIRYRSFAGSDCRTSMGLVKQAEPFKRGDAVEVRIPITSRDVLCGAGASLIKLN